MSKVRLYHLARNWDVPASEILESLAQKGRRLKSHFVEVDTAEVPEIRAILEEAGLFGRPAAATAVAEPPRETRAPEPRVPAGDGRPAVAAVAAPVVEAPRPAPAPVAPVAAAPEAPRAPRAPEPARPVVAEAVPPARAAKKSSRIPAVPPPAPPVEVKAPEPIKAPEPVKPAAKAPVPTAPAAPARAPEHPVRATPAAPRPTETPRPMAPAAQAAPPPPRPYGPPSSSTPVRPGAPARPGAPTGGTGRPPQHETRVQGAPRTGGPTAHSAAAQPAPRPAPPAGQPPRVAAQGPGAPTGGPRPTGHVVSNDNTEFRPGRIVSRAPRPDPSAAPPRPAPGFGPRPGGPGGPPGRFGPPGGPRPMGPGGPGGPGGPPGRFGPPGGRPFGRPGDFAMPEIRARTDIPVTPNLRGDEESRRRSRFGPSAPQKRGVPLGPESGEGPAGASRTAISPAKKGKQATRRSGPGGSTSGGRRMERRMHERDRWKRASTKRKRTIKAGPINRPAECVIELPISVKDLSAKFAVRVADIMQILMQPPHNLMLNMNAPVPAEAIQVLAGHFNIAAEITDEVDVDDSTVKELETAFSDEKPEDLAARQPVVAVLGHVDHGKTSLLDRLRQTKAPVAPGEAGGITQHIGAYVAEHDGRQITFLDTPGHEAFTSMRARGANVTDIVMLVVAADDGVMPQTKEAIAHAKAANATIVVAMNKIDKPNANTQKVLQQLASEGLNPVEWGGETEVIAVSALTGDGIDKLMETLLLTADIMDLKANPNRPAKGTVLEAKKTEGRGIVVSVLIEEGTLRRGDLILCGLAYGKVRMLFSDRGKPVKEAGPAVPVELIGLDEIPTAGDRIYVIEDERKAKEIVEQRLDEKRLESATKRAGVSAENIWEQLGKAEVNEVRLILKTDVTGSLEVLKNEIEKLSTKSSEVRLRLLHAQVGTITTSDVILAEASKPCFVIGFTVSPDGEANALAREKAIEIRTYKVIYELLDDLEKIMSGEIAPEEKEVVLGTVLIRQTFKSSKVGTIAGCVVEKGNVKRSGKARLMRDGVVIWEGDIEGLKRFKEDVKEVKEGFECGLRLKGYDEVKEGDKIEVYEIQKVARSL